MMLKNYRHSSLLRASLALAGLIAIHAFVPGCASRPTVPSAADQGTATSSTNPELSAGPEQNTLSQSIQDSLTGLALETPSDRERLGKEAREFVNSKKAKASSALRRQRVEACQEDEPRDGFDAAFCRLWIKSAEGSRHHSKGHTSLAKTRAGRKLLKSLVRAIEGARMEELAKLPGSQILEALKKVQDTERLRPLIEKALNTQSCAPTALLTGLGLKTEENFPDPEYKELAEALYQRSSDCGTDADAVKGAYRLGLLQVWDQNYAQAEQSFAKITDNPEAVDFRSRVIYWRFFCAKQTGNSSIQDQMKAVLAKEYHLTLHGLITVGPKPTDNRPHIAFRSVLHPELNAPVRVAEALQGEGGREASVDALDPILEALRAAEPEFQLYVGLLLMRAGDSLHKFKLLTGLYRDFPGLISRESLEMLFPLSRFEMVRHYEQKADPFLVISLIRQESAFNERAHSRVGAVGLMQLMPQTARRMERVSKRALYDPIVNIRLGVRFFAHLADRYGGDAELALAAYNAGPEKVDTWKARYPIQNRLLFVDLIPFRETREYVASIARNYYWYKKLYGDGETESKDRTPASATDKVAFFKLFDT